MFEFRPILSALARHKSSTLLIVLQIAITFAVVVNSTSIIKQRIEIMDRQSGIAEQQLITLNVNAFGKDYDFESNIRADIQMLRNTAGVIDAAPTNQIPLSGSSDSMMVSSSREKFDQFERHGTGIFSGDSHILNTLGVKLVEGRSFTENEVIYSSDRPAVRSAIITDSLAKKVFPEGNALGKLLYYGEDPITVIGIVEKMVGSIVHEPIFEENIIIPYVRLSAFKRILIRAENKAAADKLLGEVEELLIQRNPERVISGINSIGDLKAYSYSGDRAMMIILWCVAILLILITALGLVGIVSFNVNQRVKQIGTRRALGASKSDILRYFLTENILITSLGLTLGIFMTVTFNIYLVEQFNLTPINWYLIPVGMLIMFTLGILSVWMPAQKASCISPAVATQSI
jgi:putative ABC transport system permease protein